MKRIRIIRHGQSLGNKERIIQGPNTDYELTDEGKNYIEGLLEIYKESLKTAKRIFTSPLKRAKETAEIIAEKIGIKNITETSMLVEFNPGILGGKTHEECKERYPEAYAVWLERRDLDKIPFAEKGCELQARVLAFLTRYIDEQDYDDIIVSHAGFIRCFTNTVLGRDRTTPIEIHNGVIHELQNPLANLSIEKRDRAMTSNVYVIGTREGKYVIKQKNRNVNNEDREEKRILNTLDSKMHGIPIVYELFDDKDKSYKVIRYVAGEHIYGIMDREHEIALIRDFIVLSNTLSTINSSQYETLDLIEDLRKIQKTSLADYQKKYVTDLLNNYKNITKLRNSEYILTHNDLNRDNILFEKTDNGVCANFIDWEGIERCPKSYQIATFLTSAFLIEGYRIDKVMKLAEVMNFDIDRDFLSYLMQIRVFKGLHFFAEQKNEFTMANPKASVEILDKYYNAAEQLREYRLNQGFSTLDYLR